MTAASATKTKPRVNHSKKAGLSMQMRQVGRLLRQRGYGSRFSSAAAPMVTGMAECVLKAVLQKAAEHAAGDNHLRIRGWDVQRAVQGDEDYAAVFNGHFTRVGKKKRPSKKKAAEAGEAGVTVVQ
jgi:histone H3/H4